MRNGHEVIRDGSHTVYRLAGGIVARIGKPGSVEVARRELRISRWLNDSGISTVQPISTVAQPIVVDDRPVTWRHLIPDLRSSTPEELGTVLMALHALPIPAELMLVPHDPFAGLSERLSAAATVDEDDQAWLTPALPGAARAVRRAARTALAVRNSR
jgi:hypothetical protein